MIFPLYFLIKKKFKEAIILGILISTFHYFSFILLFLFFTSYLITNAQEKLNVLSKNYFLFISLVFLLVSISIVTLNNLYISESIDSALRGTSKILACRLFVMHQSSICSAAGQSVSMHSNQDVC